MSRVKVNEITNKVATGPVDFPDGITGVALTVTGNVTVGGTIISEDTTNVDSVGWVTARSGLTVGPPATGIGATIHANGNAVFAGILTATTLSGGASGLTGALPAIDGSALTGITQTTINNNANNRLITGSGTANTLEAESQVTYDGTTLQLRKNGAGEYNEIITDGNPSTDRGTLGLVSGYWDGDRVADIVFSAGDDTSNKNNGIIQFRTTQEGGGSCTPRLQIGSMGQIGLPVGPVGTAATDYGSSGQVLTSGGGSASPTWSTAGGAWTKITSGTIDAVDTIITESLDNTYQLYRLNFYVQLNANGQYFGLRIKTGGSWKTSNYWNQNLYGTSTTAAASYGSSENRIFIPNRAWRVGSGQISFGNVESTTATKVFRLEFGGNDSLDAPAGANNAMNAMTMGVHDSYTAITGIRFFKDGSAPDAGWYVLEGCAIS